MAPINVKNFPLRIETEQGELYYIYEDGVVYNAYSDIDIPLWVFAMRDAIFDEKILYRG